MNGILQGIHRRRENLQNLLNEKLIKRIDKRMIIIYNQINFKLILSLT